MPWRFSKPIEVGELDAQPYDLLRIVRFYFDYNERSVNVRIEYGYEKDTVVDGEDGQPRPVRAWQSGSIPAGKSPTIRIVGSEFEKLASSKIDSGENIYDAVKRLLYTWLSDQGHIPSGELV